jgi:hypothetical protein
MLSRSSKEKSKPSRSNSMLSSNRTKTSSNSMFRSKIRINNSNSTHRSRTKTSSSNKHSSILSVLESSSVLSRVSGSKIAQRVGSQNTEITVAISGRNMVSEFTAFPLWFMVDIHASSTRVIGLPSSTHGLNTGRVTGMTTTTSMSPTETTGTTVQRQVFGHRNCDKHLDVDTFSARHY